MADQHLNDSYKLRMPAELKAKVAESAKKHNRSMNADIVARLLESFELEDGTDLFDHNQPEETLKSTMLEFVASLIGQGVGSDKILGAINTMESLDNPTEPAHKVQTPPEPGMEPWRDE